MPRSSNHHTRQEYPPFHPDHPHNRQPLLSSSQNIPRDDMVSDSELSDPGRRCFCGREIEKAGIYCSVDCARSDAISSLCAPAPNTTEWTASHYRRLARADLRRDERKEERRRRRAEGSMASSVASSSRSSSSSRVPDLTHSRNPSSTSSRTTSSTWSSIGGLSRNPSSASSSSRRYGGVTVDDAIMEDDDEEEFLVQPKKKTAPSKKVNSFGMGQDMRDVLEEIIMMEKGFVVDDEEDKPEPGLFTATFRPPRTPSPPPNPAAAPGAPRGHRRSLSQPKEPAKDSRHQVSLSESHTALYLATASPVSGRSPVLAQRKSMTFTPTNAGPSLLRQLPLAAQSLISSPSTPSRRRPNISPTAHHPAMSNWRFPSPQTATPRKMGGTEVEPHLLWPPPPNLAPSLFPSSPAGTPDFLNRGHPAILPPSSGLRLGVLLGSGEDVEMDDDDSTAHGHDREYLPVFLEAEGFQARW